MAGAEPQRRRHRVLLVGGAGAGQVQVHAVETDLLRAGRDEPQADLSVGTGQQCTAGVVEDLPSQDTCPEGREAFRVVRVEGQSQQTGGHLAHARRRAGSPARAFKQRGRLRVM